MSRIGGIELEREIGRAPEESVDGEVAPGAAGGLREGRGQGLTQQQALVRIGHALVIALGHGEAAGLIEIVLRRGEFFEIGAGLDDGTVAAGDAQGQQVEDVELAGVLEDLSAEGGQVVGQGTGGEQSAANDELVAPAGLYTEYVAEVIARLSVGALHRIIASEPRVENG